MLAWAQAPSFEVATIKSGNPTDHRKMFGLMPGGRFSASNVTLKELIIFAYNLKDQQLSGGPGWTNSDVFDVVGKPESSATPEQIRQMMQTLLADRFKLTMRRESKELQVYNLVTAKNGPKLTESKPDEAPGPGPRRMIRMGRGELNGQQMSMGTLADALSKMAGRTVVDKTGLTGNYDVKLEWTPDAGEPQMRSMMPEGAPPPVADGPGISLFTAIQEQLGLKLDSQKGPVDVFMIERVEKPSEN
jgi:bla regulator protein blaR1